MCQISDQPSLAQVGAYGCRRPEMLACGGARAAKGAGFRVRWLSAFGGSNPLPRTFINSKDVFYVMRVRSICMYCGSGCQLEFEVENGRIVRVYPVKEDPVSEGKPCVKGLSIHDVVAHLPRVTQPMIREGDELVATTWKNALGIVLDRLENLPGKETGWIGSGEITNESNYVIGKFAREVIGSENVDSCARLCHAPTVRAYKEMLGIPATPHFWNDIYDLDLLLCVGTNPATNYPTLFTKILEARKRGLKLAAVNVWENETTRMADLKAIVKPGRMVFFIAGILHELIFHRGYSHEAEGFEDLKRSVKPFDPKTVAEITGESPENVKAFADAIDEAKEFGVMHGMKYTQTYHGTDGVRALTALALLKNGKILTGRGKVNIQGAGDMGVSPIRGLTLVEFLLIDPVEFLYTSIFNPARSMPALKRVWENLRKMFVVQATPYPNATTEFADVVLPTPLLIEQEGTITNGERRVRYVRKVVDPPKEAKPDWLILTELARLRGIKWGYKSAKDVFAEIVTRVPGYLHLDPEKIYRGEDEFAEKGIKKMRFHRIDPEIVEHPGYPYLLITGRRYMHFNTGDTTTRSPLLRKMFPENVLWIHPKDAEREGIKTGDTVRVCSPEECIELKAVIDERVKPGVVCTTFHFEESPVNILTPLDLDSETKIPAYKHVPVRLEKVI